MKQIILTMLVGIGMFIGGCGEAKKATEDAMPVIPGTPVFTSNFCKVMDETKLDFGKTHENPNNVYAYTFSELNNGKTYFKTFFKYGVSGRDTLINDPFKLSLSNVDTIINYIPKEYDSSKHYAALKMYYGIKNKRIVLIFEPILLIPESPKLCSITPSNKYFSFVDGKFETILKTDLDVLTKTYTDSVYITHKLASQRSITTFVNNDSDFEKGDIHYCIMPLQQILQMYLDNKDSVACDKMDVKDFITFSIIANNYYATGGKYIENYKLHVVTDFGLNKNSKEDNSKIFGGLASDFAELCPPNCNKVAINYYNK